MASFSLWLSGHREELRRAPLFRIAASANAKVTEYLQSRRRQRGNVPDAHFFEQCLLKFLLERRNFAPFTIFCDQTICTTRDSHRYALRSSSLLCVAGLLNDMMSRLLGTIATVLANHCQRRLLRCLKVTIANHYRYLGLRRPEHLQKSCFPAGFLAGIV